MQRFDTATLTPPPPQTPPSAAEQARLVAWRRWCLQGSGPGTRPLLQPRARPHIDRPLAIAAPTRLDSEQAARLALLLCLDLDGSWALQAGGRAAGLWLRGRTLINDACWWRSRRDNDPWDCGLLRDDDAGRAALARFVPRRATLMVAQQLSAISLAHAVASLQGRQALWTQPVRLLVVGAAPSRSSGQSTWAQLD